MAFSIKPPPKKARERLEDALYARSVVRGACRAMYTFMARPSAPAIRKKGRLGGACAKKAGRRTRMKPWGRFVLRFWMYFYKMRGKNPATYEFSVVDTLWSFGGAFLVICILALINVQLWGRQEQGLLLGSFGATAMLVFGAPHAPFAQPRNVVGGHVVSALAGVLVQQFVNEPWIASACAVALAVSAMHITATLHPPGGATALIAVVGSTELKRLGFSYALYPVGLSAAAMVLVGVLYNNLSERRRYPIYWW